MNKFLGLVILVFAACATPGSERLTELDAPLPLLQKIVVKSFPTGRRSISANDREFISNYFIPDNDVQFWTKPEAKDKTRFYARVTVLGDQRPYVIEIVVICEKVAKAWGSTQAAFQEVGVSHEYSSQLARKIKEDLTKGLKNRNVIDEFRIF